MPSKPTSRTDRKRNGIEKAPSIEAPLSKVAKDIQKAIRPIFIRYRVGSTDRLFNLTQLVVASIIAETPAGCRNPKTEALMRGIAVREHFKTMEGGHVSADDAGAILGISKVAVLDRHRKGNLLGWRAAQDAVRLPVWQFSEEGVIRGLNEVLEAWKGMAHLDDWAKVLFFLSPLDNLRNVSPLNLLRKGQVKKVVELARAYAE